MADEHKRTRGGFSEAASFQPPLSQAELARIPSPSSSHRQQQQMPRPPPLFHSAKISGKNLPSNNTAQPMQQQMHQPISSQTAVPPPPSQPHFYNNAAAAQPGPPTYTPPGIPPQQPVIAPANDNNSMPPPPVDQNPLNQFMQMMQYMAAHLPQPATGAAARDPETKMAQALEELRLHPVQVPAGLDDRSGILHEARLYGGAVCPLQQYWLDAREKHGLNGITPLASYDFETVGIAGCITSKGLYDMHNPANPNQKLKHFSSTNTTSRSQVCLADL